MKHTLLFTTFVFLFAGCDLTGNVEFGSLGEDDSFVVELESQSEEKEEKKEVRGVAKVKPKPKPKVQEEPAPVVESEGFDVEVEATLKPKNDKIDIVFYIDGYVTSNKKKGFQSCLIDFGESIIETGFISHLDKELDWQFSVSTFDKKRASNQSLEHDGMWVKRKEGNTYYHRKKIAKGEETRYYYDQFLYHSVTPLGINQRYKRWTVDDGKNPLKFLGLKHEYNSRINKEMLYYDSPQGSWKGRKDPLKGLSHLLLNGDNVRTDSNVYVLIVAHSDFPYKRDRVEAFVEKHPRVVIYALTSPKRKSRTPILNELALSSGGGWKPLCKSSNIGIDLANSILETAH